MSNLFSQNFNVKIQERRKNLEQNSLLIWFTGFSCSGKSTLANLLDEKLFQEGFKSYILDGDNIRKGLNSDLSFSPEDRTENIRRVSQVAKLFIDSGMIIIAAFVSPYRNDREKIRNLVGHNNFIEIFVNTSLEECERRDDKGLYKKARKGEILDFTGITAPYEPPVNPQIEIKTEEMSPDAAVESMFELIKSKLKV